MSVSAIPVATGGAAVLALAAAKAGGQAARSLPLTGARHVREFLILGTAMLAAGSALVRRGRRLELSAGDDLSDKTL